jgi:RNA polymerase sigma factor for flagellar operon FliA
VRNIDPDQRNVIIYHYYYEVEFKTIAEIMNLSRSRVAQLHKSGIESVREIYEKAVNLDVAY